MKRLATETYPFFILTCASVLVILSDLTRLDRITEVLEEKKWGDRASAAKTCRRLGFTVFLDPLRKRLATEEDRKVRDAIERTIYRIEKEPVVVRRISSA